MTTNKVVVTGATGLLGSSIVKAFELYAQEKWEVIPLGFTRAEGKYIKCDLTDENKTEELILSIKPHVLFHW
jgi:dTDP-4-dehydrorhamnose reductase